jgi:hypothetical protein
MSNNIIEVEANYEDVTYIGYNFRVRKYVNPYFLEKGYNPLTLFGNDAKREKFAPYCLLPDVIYISAFLDMDMMTSSADSMVRSYGKWVLMIQEKHRIKSFI